MGQEKWEKNVGNPVHDYESETVTMELIARYWDDLLAIERFTDLASKLSSGENWNDFIAPDLSAEKTERIRKNFSQYEGKPVEYVYTNFSNFYMVDDENDFNVMRGLLKFKFKVREESKVIEYTSILHMALLGDENGTLWYITDVAWQDAGVDVSDVELIQLENPRSGEEVCQIHTDAGTLKVRLFPEQAPKAVEDFVVLAKQGFYNGKEFYRVIKDFVIQTGAPDGSGKELYSIYGGCFENEVNQGIYHFNGALASSNMGPHTTGNQFYIVQNTSADLDVLPKMTLPENVDKKYAEIGGLPVLDGRYTVFGQVYEGLDIVWKIAQMETDENDAPVSNPVKITSVEFEVIE